MARCGRCGSRQLDQSTRSESRYEIRDIPRIILHDAPVVSCRRCDHSALAIADTEGLHRAVARAIVDKRQRLLPREIRFLRKQLGLFAVELAMHLGTTPETVSRWENGRTPMGVTADRLLRLMVIVKQGATYPLQKLRTAARLDARVTPIHVRWRDDAWEPTADECS
jgi:putative zinc finger/helix-turn-helix YgiT family protein